ncbi:hypothetical protein Skr01_39180 [Sphaerisporangium krabiense]|uniref:Uncharacterized protein n=1 Tax=Sphaerisporangium krabiense TaxID=763782 RepID=A0A7W8Z974_9ACTN|nr:hypothetical protein [Sphaerisporangium krabiense]MBB5629733.1 hypothetical protein [Sphaerisporangium krabiense]GII63833.1 hypothetical protein Skr01_39180 [Sphaerisporangium krabiense]
MREQGSAVAWVESPLQLLCAVEARHAGVAGPEMRVVTRAKLPALRVTRTELTSLDLPPGLAIETASGRMPRPGRRAAWVLGDAFSGRVQLTSLTALPSRIVLVDDGLATIRVLEQLTSRAGTSLLRARVQATPSRRALGLAAALRLRAAARAGRLTVFTALPVPAGLAAAVRRLGAELITHDFAWLRSQPAARHPRPREDTVVLGTSLVRNGLIHRDRYLSWLFALKGPLAYYPHRREDPGDLAAVRDHPGVTVYDGGVPVEMTLRDLRPGQRVLSLPSTAVTSLRVLLSARGVPVETVDVPDDWWTPSASVSLRSHLQMFAHERAAP